jgi:hypothetical protein
MRGLSDLSDRGGVFEAEMIFDPSSVGLSPDTFSRKGRRIARRHLTP